MENGLNVNCPLGNHILADYYGHISLFTQTSIILPKKGNTYYVFSTGMSDSAANIYLNKIDTKFDVLNYSIVDMDSNNGKGKVVLKNKILMDHQEYANCALSAVRHGNGKDWWLVKADCYYNRFQLFLVQEDTILGPFYQYSEDTSVYCYGFGQVYFSQDGSKLATSVYGGRYFNGNNISYLPDNVKYTSPDGITYIQNRVDLYDFDRCNGTIKFNNFYVAPFDTISYPNWDDKSGICFSPNGKLMYMSNMYTIYQIDLEDTNKSNALFITGPDTSIAQFPWYNEMACGPDGRIYIGTFSGSYYMSYIANPNIRGLGCNFTPHGIWQPYTGLQDPPNMPYFGLGALEYSACDTIGKLNSGDVVVYPNPVGSNLHVYIPKPMNSKVQLALYNLLGQRVAAWKEVLDRKQEVNVNLPALPTGLYTLDIVCDGKEYMRKLLVE